MKEYKRKHGDCNVPVPTMKSYVPGGKYMQLGIWIMKIRDRCKKYLSSEKTPSYASRMYMDEEKMQRLNKIGFEVHPSVFSRRFQELKHFKKIHGHINVPKTGSFGSLGRWCCLVKRACRNFEASMPLPRRSHPCIMNSDRFEMLRAIGFEL